MQENAENNIMVKILVSPRFRIIRHLILIILTTSIAAGFIWHMIDEGQLTTSCDKYIGLLLFTLLFLGGSYLNIYILTPKLLLKNRWGIYFCSLLGIVLLIMASIIFSQTVYFEKEDSIPEDVNFLSVFVNIMSSSLSIFLLFAGTTTLALFKYWIENMQQSEELESATLQLELKLLENQINPHFLFNMLNNANIMIKKDPDVALHIINKLEEMLRYQMSEGLRQKVYLEEEILFLTDFLELEKTRRDYFSYCITKEGETDNIQIPPLLFITFVENAVKHNQDSQTASYVYIIFKLTDKKLTFICENSIPQKAANKQVGGIGLTNIKRRLDLLFKDSYSLEQTKTETNYIVKLELKL